MGHHTPQQAKRLTVSVIGASGYSGAELIRLLLRHPHLSIDSLYAHSQAGKRVSELYPSLSCDMVFQSYAGQTESDVYFLALPHGEALRILPSLVAAGKVVVDLSGDFRLKNVQEHGSFYHQQKSPDACLQYGMPELFREEIMHSRAVSNPGCYATGIILGLAPLFRGKARDLRIESAACTSVSGLSGAGRTSKTELSFSEMSGNVRAYKVGMHQHTPEILQALDAPAGNGAFGFLFTPMIAPYVRGIYSVMTVTLGGCFDREEISTLYRDFYAGAPFVRLRESMTEVSHVVHTNLCDVHLAHAAGRSLVVITAIDNLLKGAAGQAVQNMNLMLGFDETTALL
jgi:N-acetyl-gamma-glutamyl-phosphate reductase